MLPPLAQGALSTLTVALAARPELEPALRGRWRPGGERLGGDLPEDLRTAADLLGGSLPTLTQAEEDEAPLGELFHEAGGAVILAWCAASAWRRDARMASLLKSAAQSDFRDRVPQAARARVVEGPLLDALSSAPFLGRGADLAAPENVEARARLEILIWEAGASALEVPSLGSWLWG